MRNFKRFVALVLCAVMLAGITPVAINTNKVVAADTPAVETAATGIIQGENDLVILYDKQNLTGQYFYVSYLILYTTYSSPTIEGFVGKSVKEFDRTIIVFTSDYEVKPTDSLTSSAIYAKFYSGSSLGTENVVFTQKCTVTNPEYVVKIEEKPDAGNKTTPNYTYMKETIEAELATSGKTTKLYNFYNNSDPTQNAYFIMDQATYTKDGVDKTTLLIMKFGCNVTFDFMNMMYTQKNVCFYAQGFDFTIGKNVKFLYGDENNSGAGGETYRPIVVNGSYLNNKSFQKNEQTITLLGGNYQYALPRSRSTHKDLTDLTINLVLGNIRLLHGTYNGIVGNDTLNGTTINVYMNGTDYRDPLYILDGTEYGTSSAAASASITDSTINFYITDAEFNEKGGIVGSRVPGDAGDVAYTVNSLDINVFIKEITLKDGYTFAPEVDSNGNAVANVNSSIYYDANFLPSDTYGESVINNFDNAYTVSVEDSDPAYCTSGGTGFYAYEDAEGNLVSETWTCEAATAHDEIRYNVGGDSENPASVYCRHCHYKHVLETDEYGNPIIYLDSVNGKAGNSGYSAEYPKVSLTNACDAVKKFQRGGTIVICGNSSFNDSVLNDTNGMLTLTSMENGEGGYYTIQFKGALVSHNDLYFDNLHIKGTEDVKTIFLNYKNFVVYDNCEYYPLDEAAPYRLGIVAGARGSQPAQIESYATDLADVEQCIDLYALDWAYVMAGTKNTTHQFEAEGPFVTINCSPDLAVNCYGKTDVYVYGQARVANVDLVNNGVVANFYFENNNLVFDDVDPETYPLFSYTEDVTAIHGDLSAVNTAELVYVYDYDIFGEVSYQEKRDGEKLLGGRVTFTTADEFADWVDKAVVKEFGVLMTVAGSEWSMKYMEDSHAGGVGKSVCFDETHNDYRYDGENPVEFSGQILCQDEEGNDMSDVYMENAFAAVPYAVVDSAEAGGAYTVIGNFAFFNYEGIIIN